MARQRKKGIRGGGTVFLRKDGRWEAKFLVEETGRYKSLYAPTEREAYEKLQTALQEQRQGMLATGPNQKLKVYLEDWLENVHKPKIRFSTYTRHRTIIYRHIIPTLGHIELRKLTPQKVQKLYADKEKEGLAKVSVRDIHKVLHNALKNAVRWNLISQNVCDKVSAPQAEKRERQMLTQEQIQHLLEVADRHEDMGALVKLAMMTGMRHGELLG